MGQGLPEWQGHRERRVPEALCGMVLWVGLLLLDHLASAWRPELADVDL